MEFHAQHQPTLNHGSPSTITLYHELDTNHATEIMPRYREFYWIETVVHNALEQLVAIISRPIRSTPFEYWLLERDGQIGTFFFSLILGSFIWLICLDYAVRRSSRLVALAASAHGAEAQIDAVASEMVHTPASAQHDNAVPTPSTGDTPFMKKLAPPGHRPTNARLDISPFHLARNLGRPPIFSTSTSSSPPPPPQGRDFDSSGLIKATAPPMDRDCSPGVGDNRFPRSSPPFQGPNFSALKENSPVSYETLRERGLLDKDGSPTRKFRLHQLLDEGM